MALENGMTNRLRARQRTMFRVAKRDHGITQKLIHLETGISITSLCEYARGLSSMSGEAILKLAEWKDFPSEMLSILFDGTDRHIVDGDDDEELDTLGEDADAVAAEVRRARHPRSPGGTDITDIEEARIRMKASKLRRKVANG